MVSRCPALGSQSASDTAGPAWVCPTVQPEPRLLRKSCETVTGMLEKTKVQSRVGVLRWELLKDSAGKMAKYELLKEESRAAGQDERQRLR